MEVYSRDYFISWTKELTEAGLLYAHDPTRRTRVRWEPPSDV